jgi:glucosamine-6-phosphate deaminase
VLQLHPHVTVVVDEAAAAQLEDAEFYRYALKYKPPQQKY